MSIVRDDPFAETYRLALCQEIKHGWFTVWPLNSDGNVPHEYVRISEPVDIVFQKVNSTEGVQQALKAIDAMEREARNELNRKLSVFSDRRASLLALTHESEGK